MLEYVESEIEEQSNQNKNENILEIEKILNPALNFNLERQKINQHRPYQD